MMEKAKIMKKMEKKRKSKKKSSSICVEQGDIQRKTYVFIASVGPLIPLPQHEETHRRFYLSQIL